MDKPPYTLRVEIVGDTREAIYRALADIESMVLSSEDAKVSLQQDVAYIAELIVRETPAQNKRK